MSQGEPHLVQCTSQTLQFQKPIPNRTELELRYISNEPGLSAPVQAAPHDQSVQMAKMKLAAFLRPGCQTDADTCTYGYTEASQQIRFEADIEIEMEIHILRDAEILRYRYRFRCGDGMGGNCSSDAQLKKKNKRDQPRQSKYRRACLT